MSEPVTQLSRRSLAEQVTDSLIEYIIAEGLTEGDSRLRGFDFGGGSLAAEVLGDDEQNAFFPGIGLERAAGVDAELGGFVSAPQGEVEDGSVEADAGLRNPVGPDVLGEIRKPEANCGLQVDAVHGFLDASVDLGQEAGASKGAVLLGLGGIQGGEDDLGILFERQRHGIAEGQFERSGLLGQSGSREREEKNNAPVHIGPGCTRDASRKCL